MYQLSPAHANQYVVDLERRLSDSLSRPINSPLNESMLRTFAPVPVYLPPHFLGELAKTEDGCRLIRKHGLMLYYLEQLQSSSVSWLEKRAAMWALGALLALTLLS